MDSKYNPLRNGGTCSVLCPMACQHALFNVGPKVFAVEAYNPKSGIELSCVLHTLDELGNGADSNNVYNRSGKTVP